MTTLRINRHSPVPYYRQIEEWIRNRIRNGELQPGDAIENEIALAQTLGVSRITVRQALDNLASQGYLIRKRALGTFVAEPRKSFVLTRPYLRSLTEEMAEEGLTLTSKTLEQKVITPNEEIRRQLNLAEGETVILIRRLRSADGTPLCVETCYHPYHAFPSLAEIDLTNQSIYEILEREYQRRPVTAKDTLVADTATGLVAHWLQVESGAAVMRILRLAYDAQQIPIEVTQTVFRADRHQIVIEYQE
ncbi:MAG: phosphonate metabolism transcriptional regulator PhnF [Anaerolineae bacterium]|jgi:GntR family transcriptional regulator|nr:MAG: phosphonate metabolism transcriptional regulator PhnF [Anaerolineae bacterium]